MKRELTAKQKRILHHQDNGKLTFREIGNMYNVSGDRARQIYMQACLIRDAPARWTDGLSVRASNVLWNSGCWSKEEIMILARSGNLKKYRNCGKKTAREIRKWLGLEH